MSRSPLPLDLVAEVTTADGVKYRWDGNQPPGSRLRNLSFSTKIGEGFSSAQGQLARRIDLDYPDLSLVDTVTFRGADGSVAWEGRLSAIPRQLDDAHSISLTWAGWMAHAKDRPFQEIYVDRDLGSWGDPTTSYRAARLGGGFGTVSGPQQVADPDNNEAALATQITGSWVTGFQPIVEALYDGGAVKLGKVVFSWRREGSSITTSDTNWLWLVRFASDDVETAAADTGNLRAAGPVTNQAFSAGTPSGYRYLKLLFAYLATGGGTDGNTFSVLWKKLAVYGTHGLTLTTGDPAEPPGVLASEVIRHIASKWCPQLSVAGVEDTSYVIQHLTFKDLTDPFDAFLEVNKYHLWQLAVWEDRTLHFKPYNLLDYDWEIRTDDQGTTFEPAGPSIDDVYSGVVVTYTDALKGTKEVLTPDQFPNDLTSGDPENPWNMHGVNRWYTVNLSSPTTQAQALQLGRAALADKNTPKTPGTITVSGYVRDRAGTLQPVWKIRAGDTIAVTNYPNDRPRLIVETSYDDESKKAQLSIDRPFALLDAYIDRLGTALGARNLT